MRKVNSLINKDLSEIIAHEVDFKQGVFVTIAKVDTSRDLRYTRVSVGVFPTREKDYVMKTLKKEMYVLQGALNKRLHMKRLPHIEFLYDDTEARADDLEQILKQTP